jgi:hypothetical protein
MNDDQLPLDLARPRSDFHADGRRKTPVEYAAELDSGFPALARLLEQTRRRARRRDGSVKSSAELIDELYKEEPELMAAAKAVASKAHSRD